MIETPPSIDRAGDKLIHIPSLLQSSVELAWRYRSYLARLVVIPLGISFLTSLALEPFTPTDDSFPIIGLCLSVPATMAFTMFAVACHRLFLLQDQGTLRDVFAHWSMRETRFLGWLICIVLLALAATAATSPVIFVVTLILGSLGGLLGGTVGHSDQGWAVMGYALFPLIGFVYAYIVGRISLLLPGTAVDQHRSLASAWTLSEVNDWRLMVLVGGIPAILWVVREFVETVLFPGEGTWYMLALFTLLEYSTTPVEIAILSLAFRELSNFSPPSRLDSAPVSAST